MKQKVIICGAGRVGTSIAEHLSNEGFDITVIDSNSEAIQRITELYVDVSCKEIVDNLANHINEDLDLIIDDASHNLKDILLALPILFRKLKQNGFYVIEDADQFKVYKELNPTNEKMTPIQILKNIKNNRKFSSKFLSKTDKDYLKKNIKNFYFEKGKSIVNGYNISDIVFLRKK